MDLGAVALSASNAAVVGTGVGYSDASYALDVQYNVIVHIGCCCVCRCYVCFWPLQLLCIAALICEYTVITTLRANI